MALICAEHKTHSGLAMVQAAPAGRSHRKPVLYFGERHTPCGLFGGQGGTKTGYSLNVPVCPTLSFYQCPTLILHSSTTANYNVSN
jgi:hypothetical protein